MTDTAAKAGIFRVRFDGVLALHDGDAIKARLLDALRDHPAVEVDGSTVTDADLGAVQLLMSARRTAQSWGKAFTLILPSQGGLRDVLIRTGLIDPDGTGADVGIRPAMQTLEVV